MESGGQPADETAPRPAGAAILRNPYVWAFVLGIVTLTLIRPLLRREPSPPPVLGELPAFTLVDSAGRELGSSDLAGRVWIASFLFTRCPSICPRLTQTLSRLDARFEAAAVDGVHLVSITVDPEYDTPERLREFGEAHSIDPRRWSLLTGPASAVRELVEGGFKTPMGKPETQGSLIDIAHTGKLILVDGRGRIRGYYDSDGPGEDEVFHRAQHVLAEAGR